MPSTCYPLWSSSRCLLALFSTAAHLAIRFSIAAYSKASHFTSNTLHCLEIFYYFHFLQILLSELRNSRRIYSCRDQQHMFQWGSVSLSNSCQLTISHRNLFVCSQDAQSLRICEAGHQIQQTPGSLSSIYHRIQSGPEGPIQNKHTNSTSGDREDIEAGVRPLCCWSLWFYHHLPMRLCQDHRWGRDNLDGQQLRLLLIWSISNYHNENQHSGNILPHGWH